MLKYPNILLLPNFPRDNNNHGSHCLPHLSVSHDTHPPVFDVFIVFSCRDRNIMKTSPRKDIHPNLHGEAILEEKMRHKILNLIASRAISTTRKPSILKALV
jgi:hypothetical protein